MILSFLLTIFSTYFLASVFGSFAYIFPIMLGLIILNIEILSLFRAIDFPWILLLNVLTLVLILVVWVKKGRPVLRPDMGSLKAEFKRILNCFKLDKSFIILGAGLVFLMATGFVLAAFLPVNEPDALEYHAYRVIVWAQQGFINHFDTFDSRNLVMPINSEIIYTWIYTLTKKDAGFGLLEFFSYVFGISGLWMFLSRLKISYRKKLWTIFIFSSFAGVISQISSTQTDLLVGTLLLYSMIFFYDYVNIEANPEKKVAPDICTKTSFTKGFFSSLCFGIALGVKSTGFIAGLPLLILFFIYAYRKKVLKRFLWFFIALGINFIVFSSYNYILNFIDYLNPFGAQLSINRHGFFGGFKGFIANFVRYNIQLLDFSGFSIGYYLSGPVFAIKNGIFSILNISPETGVITEIENLNYTLSERTMGFGITGVLVFIPCLFFAFFNLIKFTVLKIKKNIQPNEKYFIIYSLSLLFYLCLIVLSFAIGDKV